MHKNRAFFRQLIHHVAVVHNLAAHVDRRAEGLQRDLDNVDGPHYPGAKTPWFEQQHPLLQGRSRVSAFVCDGFEQRTGHTFSIPTGGLKQQQRNEGVTGRSGPVPDGGGRFNPHKKTVGGRRGLYSLRKNSVGKARNVRARPQSRRKRHSLDVGFTGCGKTPRKGHEVSGHDFSRAASRAIGTRALAPVGRLHTRFACCSPFFRSLFSPCGRSLTRFGCCLHILRSPLSHCRVPQARLRINRRKRAHTNRKTRSTASPRAFSGLPSTFPDGWGKSSAGWPFQPLA